MKRRIAFFLALLLPIAAGAPLFAAGAKEEATPSGALQPVTLKVMLFGDKPVHMDEVVAEFEKRTKATLNTRLAIEWNPSADHKQKLLLRITAGEELDLVFDSTWLHLNTLSKDGAYVDLEPYFMNSKYPGLQKIFSKEYLDANRFFGRIFAIPLTQFYYDVEGLLLRKDLMTKYGFAEVRSYGEMKKFFDAVKKGEPGMFPLATDGRVGFFQMFDDDALDRSQAGIFGASPFLVALSKDRKKLLGAMYQSEGRWAGDPEEFVAAFPAPYNTTAYWSTLCRTFREWNQYLEPDVMSQTNGAAPFIAGKAAAGNRLIGKGSTVLPQVKKVKPEAELYAFPFAKGVREQIPHSQYTSYKVWNFLCVPRTSKVPDRVMSFMNWVFESEANHDLFELGIEGTMWEKAGTGSFRRLGPAEQQYVFPWYELTGTPLLWRTPSDWTDGEKKYYAWAANPDRYTLDPLTGFTFDNSSVKAEKAKVDAIYSAISVGINCGAFEDPVAVLQKANADARTAGLEKIRAEYVRQLQAFLTSKYGG